ncbi:hypothetical protein C8034_v011016 [Colletotrichum sidae]|uniref:Uncharacterized protein n=1 Tax=Colletotrichum sidae TaxID=1347389 RepID=A0A4R8TJJ7_9PEZI|nr:hypothetical protein C8034_v011016 [Colletotrichum sidae]
MAQPTFGVFSSRSSDPANPSSQHGTPELCPDRCRESITFHSRKKGLILKRAPIIVQETAVGIVDVDGIRAVTTSKKGRPVSSDALRGTSGNVRGFIDILDAQSEIKPSGFQNRVKAAGVRDYGEDVADRNIGENGVDLTSAKVQEFYATNGSHGDRQDGTSAPVVSRARLGDKESPFKPPQRQDSLELEGRTRSLTSTSLSQIPFRTTIFSPERSDRHETIFEDGHEPVRGRRRQSLGSYIPTTPTPAPLGLHKRATDSPASPSARRNGRRSSASGDGPLNELGIYTPPSSRSVTDSPKSPRTTQKPVYVVKHNYSLPVQQRPKTSASQMSTQAAEIFPAARPPSRGGRYSLSSTGAPAASHHVEWSRKAEPEGGDGASGWVGRVEVESLVDPADVSSPAPSPHVMRSGHSLREGYDDRLRLGSPFGKTQLDEIYEHVPMRTSSVRDWSISSATPTVSSCSSFQRPQSRHTTNTSVDLATMSSFMNDSRSSLHSATGDDKSFCTALESKLPPPLSPLYDITPGGGGGFSIDDYLSSDDDVDADSFITTRHRRSGAEEELLFSESGYGEGGLQLPGLFDSLTSEPDPTFTSPSRPSLRNSYGSPVCFQRRLSLDPRVEAPYLSFDEEDDDLGDYDIPFRADLALGRRGTRRISAIGTVYQRIEEEMEEDKVDVSTAIKLRKEAKAKQRAMARVSRSQKKLADESGPL